MISHHSPGPPPHGTRARYLKPHRCRCADCRRASADYNREWRRRVQADPRPNLNHGTISTYANHRCRCADCRAAMAAYHQRRKALR